MLRIRLRRTGKKKQASYRVVVADQRDPRDGDFVEIVGHYNPRTDPSTIVLKEDRIRHWLSKGAQPSETVHRMLHKQGIYDVEPPKRVTKPSRAEREAEATAAADAEAAETAKADAAKAEAAKAEAAKAEAAEAATESDASDATSDDETPSED